MARYADIDDLIINKSHCDRDGKRFVYCDDIEPTADVVDRKDLDKITEAHEQIGYEKGYRDGYAQANAVEVVRCEDCVFLEILNGDTYYARCNWHGRLFDSFGRVDTRTWFCADGKRRTEDGET